MIARINVCAPAGPGQPLTPVKDPVTPAPPMLLQFSEVHGVNVFDEFMKAMIRGDHESLDLSDAIAKSIPRKLRKLQRD